MRASRAACVILFGSVALWVGGCQDGGPAEAPDTAPLALDDPNLYYVLAHGGTCYVGRVRAVLVDDAGFLEGKGWPYERGTLRLAVEEALQGPAAKEVGVPFYWTEDPKGRPATLLADWGPPDSKWEGRKPKVGQHLLIVQCRKDDEYQLDQLGDHGTPVHYVRRLTRDDSAVADFRHATRFIVAQRVEDAQPHYRALCAREGELWRKFTLRAAFDEEAQEHGPRRQLPLALDFLRLVAPRSREDWARRDVTGYLGGYLCRWKDALPIPEQLRRAACDWFVGEANAGPNCYSRRRALVDALDRMLEGLGPGRVRALFGKDELARLTGRLQNWDIPPDVREDDYGTRLPGLLRRLER